MSDIHLGKAYLEKKKGTITIKVFFHVPNTGNAFPGGSSKISGLKQTEIDGLAAGSLVEVVKSIRVDIGKGKAASRIKIRGLWLGVALRTQAKLNKEYAMYGEALDRG